MTTTTQCLLALNQVNADHILDICHDVYQFDPSMVDFIDNATDNTLIVWLWPDEFYIDRNNHDFQAFLTTIENMPNVSVFIR